MSRTQCHIEVFSSQSPCIIIPRPKESRPKEETILIRIFAVNDTGTTRMRYLVLLYLIGCTCSWSFSLKPCGCHGLAFRGSSALSAVVSYPKPVPGPTNLPSRSEQLELLRNSSQDNKFDVLVIGGGATGCGIALDAASRGLSMACIEKSDFGSQTSSRSTKLIWAGLKYLATAFAALLSFDLITKPVATVQDFAHEFNMVLHCHTERRYMTEKQPHLVYWLPILVPFDRWVVNPPPFGNPLFSISPLVAPLLFKFYDALSGFSCPPSHVLTKEQALQRFPQLDDSNLKYCAVFYEGHHNDARTCVSIAMTAAQDGAAIANYAEMKEFVKDANGKVVGVQVVDNMTGDTFDVAAHKVVLAGGPFTDQLW